MMLWGMSPTVISEVAQSAMGFWEYQKRQEINYLAHRLSLQQADAQTSELKAREKIEAALQQHGEAVERLKRAQSESGAHAALLSEKDSQIQDLQRQVQRFQEQRMQQSQSRPPMARFIL